MLSVSFRRVGVLLAFREPACVTPRGRESSRSLASRWLRVEVPPAKSHKLARVRKERRLAHRGGKQRLRPVLLG